MTREKRSHHHQHRLCRQRTSRRQNGEDWDGKTAETAEEEDERAGRRRQSGSGEEKRGTGEAECVEETSRRRGEIRERNAEIEVEKVGVGVLSL